MCIRDRHLHLLTLSVSEKSSVELLSSYISSDAPVFVVFCSSDWHRFLTLFMTFHKRKRLDGIFSLRRIEIVRNPRLYNKSVKLDNFIFVPCQSISSSNRKTVSVNEKNDPARVDKKMLMNWAQVG